jgi:shikimate 5-dehydrogenase
MFVNQAVAQFERWTAKPAPRAVMREVVSRRLGVWQE